MLPSVQMETWTQQPAEKCDWVYTPEGEGTSLHKESENN